MKEILVSGYVPWSVPLCCRFPKDTQPGLVRAEVTILICYIYYPSFILIIIIKASSFGGLRARTYTTHTYT